MSEFNEIAPTLIMKNTWIKFLQQAGAKFEDNSVIHFGMADEERQQALHGNIIADLSHFALIKVFGSDAEKFLQGQFTNDVRKVSATHSQLSAWCSAKGRIIVNFRLFKRDEAFYLLLPEQSKTAMLKRLQMYVLRADVKLEDVSDKFFRIGIAGANSQEILADCLGFAPPTEVDASLTVEQVTLLQVPGISPRYMVFSVAEKALENLWQCAVTKTVTPVGVGVWELLDIVAGLPQIVPATAEAFVPQMVNYHTIGGVSFKKGCYTGQEVVARMQYLGKLKRRMYLAKIDTASLPEPGDALFVSSDEQSVGQIVNAQVHPDGGVIVLAVIKISYAETEKIHWRSQQGECLQLVDLPY